MPVLRWFSLFTLTALLLLVFGGRIGETVAGAVGLLLTGLTLVYWLAPVAGRRWRWITPGSGFALLAWLVMSSGLRMYVAHFGNYNATYGSIGGVILLMLWLYLSAVALLVGAEIDSAVAEAAAERAEPRRAAARSPIEAAG